MPASDRFEGVELVLDRLARWAKKNPDKSMYNFYKDDGETLVKSYTYREFDIETRTLSRALVASKDVGGYGIKPGSRVLLVYPPSLDFIVAFIACLRADIIAVPVFPPDPTQLRKSLFMFTSIQTDCGATVALTNTLYSWAKKVSSIKNFFSRSSSNWPDLQWIQTDSSHKEIPLSSLPELSNPPEDHVAFLQYTSGSTSAPKGVMLLHGTLSHNLALIVRSLGDGEATTEVSWLPQYHDMGLIGSYLGLLYCGGTGYYCSPISFLRDPVVWLKMLSLYHVSHTQIPNFALRLSLRKYRAKKEKPKLDLSNLRHIFNAAEPILAEDCKDFFDEFGPMGLRTTAVTPGYGLAEHTVYVCDGSHTILCVKTDSVAASNVEVVGTATLDNIPTTTPEGCHNLVSCGYLAGSGKNPEIKLIIVDQKTGERKPDLQVGEIWIDSPSKAVGYWGMEEKSQEDFFHDGPGADGDPDGFRRKYLRTGDLGFIHNNELYVCGRSKDLIIIRGRNHYPQDLEHCCESTDSAIRGGCLAAFSVTRGGGEQLVIVAEVRDPKEIGDASAAQKRILKMNEALMKTYGVGPVEFVIIKPRTIPKTSSGKIARNRTKRSFIGRPQSKEDELQVLYRWKQSDAVEHHDGSIEDGGSKSSPGDDEPVWQRNAALLNTAKAVELLRKLKEEIVLLLPEDSGITIKSIDERRSLLQLGLDSMLLEQFKTTLEGEYSVEMDIEMLFQNITTLEVIVELILDPEPTLEKLRVEVEKNRVEMPEDEEDEGGAAKEPRDSQKISPEPDDSSAQVPAPQRKYVDADETVDEQKQSSSPCSGSGCIIS